MFKFTFQIVLLVMILLFGVFLGMDTAEKGIYSIEGMPSAPTQSFEMEKLDDESIQVSVFGKSIANTVSVAPSEDFISGLGNNIGLFITEATRTGVDFLLGLLE